LSGRLPTEQKGPGETAVLQSGVLGAATTIVLPRPVVEGFPEPGLPVRHRVMRAVASTLGKTCCAAKGRQGVIVISLGGLPPRCEQQGEGDAPVSWQS
jgi:hypothetical protein